MERKKLSLFYGAAFALPAAIWLTVCIMMRIAPFGTASFLIADMQKQYADYFAYYKTLFGGENNLFYTFAKCLGGDMTGFFAYYLTSPANLLFLFLKTEWIPAGVTVLIVLKLSFCGVSMAYYAKHRFCGQECAGIGGKMPWEILLFSTAYACMGYVTANSFNVMWLDGVLWLPIVCIGIERLLLGQKPYTYTGALFMTLFCNYYIGYMVCIFSVLYFGYRILVMGEKRGLWKKLWRFGTASLLAAGLCAVLLLPAFLALEGSQKDADDLQAGVLFPNLNPVKVLSKLFTLAFDSQEIMNGMPHIFCGILMLVLLVLFFFQKKIAIKERVLSGAFLGIMMGSFCLAKADFAWHAFMEPSGYHYRYAFLFVFLLLSYACQGYLAGKEGMQKRRFFYAAGVLALLFCMIFQYQYTYLDLKKALPDMLAAFLFLPLLYWLQKTKDKRLLFLLIFLQSVNLSAGAVFVYMQQQGAYHGTAQEYAAQQARIAPVIAELKRQDPGFYRIENLNPKGTNDAMRFSYAGLTHYSSNEKNFVLSFLEKMGLNNNKLYVEYGTGTTQAVDSLLGIKYLLGTKQSINKPYQPLSFANTQLVAYQNPYALPIGFLASLDIASVDMKEEDPFALQNAMYGKAAALGQEETKIFKKAKILHVLKSNCVEEKRGNLTFFSRRKEMPIGVSYVLKAQSDGRLYAYVSAQDIPQAAEVYLNGKFLCGYLNRSNWKILNLGEYKKDEQLVFTLRAYGEELIVENAWFASEDEAALARAYKEIAKTPVHVIRKSSSRLVAQTEAAEEKMMVFTIPYEDSWRVTVDGKRVMPQKAYGTFLAFPLGKGWHQIALAYVPKGLFAGAAVSLLCFLLLAGMLLAEKRKKKQYSKEPETGSQEMAWADMHADDFGVSCHTSEDIIECLKKGALDSISVIVNMSCFAACVELFEKNRAFFPKQPLISVHLNVLDGRALLAKEDIPDLTDADGVFSLSWGKVLWLHFAGKKQREKVKAQLKKEFAAQIALAKNAFGLEELRIDSHQHMHMVPFVFDVLMELCKELRENGEKIAFVRLSKEPLGLFFVQVGLYPTYSPVNLLKNLLLNAFAAQNRKKLEAQGIPYGLLWGLLMSGSMDILRVRELFDAMLRYAKKKQLPVEILFHPGRMLIQEQTQEYKKEGFLHFYKSSAREIEKNALCQMRCEKN